MARAGCDARPLEHIAQPHPGPSRIADSATLPLDAGGMGFEKRSSVSTALQDRRDRDFFELSKILKT